MALSRKASVLVGLGIGSAIAAAVFGMTQLLKQDEVQLTKAQALPEGEQRETEKPAGPSPAAPDENNEDSIVQRLAPTPEDEAKTLTPIIQDALGVP